MSVGGHCVEAYASMRTMEHGRPATFANRGIKTEGPGGRTHPSRSAEAERHNFLHDVVFCLRNRAERISSTARFAWSELGQRRLLYPRSWPPSR